MNPASRATRIELEAYRTVQRIIATGRDAAQIDRVLSVAAFDIAIAYAKRTLGPTAMVDEIENLAAAIYAQHVANALNTETP